MMTVQELRNLPTQALLKFSKTLSTTDYQKLRKSDIKKIRMFICSDGCTGVPDIYLSACIVHDFWYRLHRDLDGTLITREVADARFRQMMQEKSKFKLFSPVALWRWLGVRAFGSKAWENT